ncbi:hypothetical protein PQX77_015093 [Marasmius sp. AFHP31]|nr:hypothetical protein PQX77_015093 [Marasmius sp. AFHP31]
MQIKQFALFTFLLPTVLAGVIPRGILSSEKRNNDEGLAARQGGLLGDLGDGSLGAVDGIDEVPEGIL